MTFFLSPYKPIAIKIKDSSIEISKSEKFLSVTTDSNLSFDNNITSQKIHESFRVASYMTFG